MYFILISQKQATLLAMYREEKRALTRDREEDFTLFQEKCRNFKSLVGQIKNMDVLSTKNLETEVAITFMELKQLSRYEKYRWNNLRDTANLNRVKVDEFHLKLENLLYEVIFLEKEVKRSLDYKSKADDVDLIDLETFLKEAPDSLKETKGDQHQLTLSRLEWELKQRITLADKIQQSELLNGQNVDEVRKMQELLGRLRSSMTCVVDALRPATSELLNQNDNDNEAGQDQETGEDQDTSSQKDGQEEEGMEVDLN